MNVTVMVECVGCGHHEEVREEDGPRSTRSRRPPVGSGERPDRRVWGRCPRCLGDRPGNDDPRFGLSFAPPCEHCGCSFIPERERPLRVWVCPYCLKQHDFDPGVRDPNDRARCVHRAPGGVVVRNPRLIEIKVSPVASLSPMPLPGAASGGGEPDA